MLAAVRTGILGGTFDPVHVGHLALARAALEELHLEHVLFVPNADPLGGRLSINSFIDPED